MPLFIHNYEKYWKERIWVNPTGGPLRGHDAYGEGFWGASRVKKVKGKPPKQYRHPGSDYTGAVGQPVVDAVTGIVGKIGFPYNNDLSYRYVQINTPDGLKVRHFYVQPRAGLVLGSVVKAGDVIGTLQSLQKRYHEITNHVHLEIRMGDLRLNPEVLIPEK